MKYMYITNNPEVAKVAENNGVDRIFIDMEVLGKEERQKNMNSVKLNHTFRDVENIKQVIATSDILVRVNPIYDGSKEEIDKVITCGADIIMLPYWKSVDEVKCFLEYVNKRVKTTLLLETKEAVECVDEVLNLDFDEIHIGLNDLHLSYGLTFMFEPLSNGTVETLCNKFRAKGIPYGFGGVAKLGEGMLQAEKILMEHYRLGSTRAILSRAFCDCAKIEDISEIENIFNANMVLLRDYEKSMEYFSKEEFEDNRKEVVSCVKKIVGNIRG